MNTNTQLQALANEVGRGERGRFMCPECNGGSKRERSLTITREGVAAHCNCWRASCTLGYRRVQTDGTFVTRTVTAHPPRRTAWEYPTTLLEGLEEAEFNMNFFDTPLAIRVTGDGRAVIPILDRVGVRRGDIVRQPKPYDDTKPKSLSLFEEGYSGIAWFVPESEDAHTQLCCVEDPLSAMRLAKHGVIGVALLGTRITMPKLRDLRRWTRDSEHPINLALDADAHMQAVKQARQLRNVADIRVHRIYDDVKDMDSNELRNFLGVLGV